ncbi:hypothetical protein P171DRAFT_479550 [Karstenula rhodostoma CBS 690.94]|uniref:Uncharacterized protein n=1 Tax=Karstenula rhodostoma CBS 690.94 TaxID=1392251 RepID=A0A9P4PUJ0_9PLEO|nr:hypothetical protein P171DRAFT_479550 [Karstenula rhodostoma CBS 690.94]
MSSLISFTALYTEEGRSKILNAPTNHWRMRQIIQYLGLKHETCNNKTLFSSRRVNTLANEIQRTASEFVAVLYSPRISGGDGLMPTKLEIRDEPSFINIARTIAREYGPLLWHRMARGHLYLPVEVRGHEGLYWDRAEDAEVIMFLIRCWLIRQTFSRCRCRRARSRPAEYLGMHHTRIPGVSRTQIRIPVERAGDVEESDSDDMPFARCRGRVQAGHRTKKPRWAQRALLPSSSSNSDDMSLLLDAQSSPHPGRTRRAQPPEPSDPDSDSDDTPLIRKRTPLQLRPSNKQPIQNRRTPSPSASPDLTPTRRQTRAQPKTTYQPDAAYTPSSDDEAAPTEPPSDDARPSSRSSSTFSDLVLEHAFSITPDRTTPRSHQKRSPPSYTHVRKALCCRCKRPAYGRLVACNKSQGPRNGWVNPTYAAEVEDVSEDEAEALRWFCPECDPGGFGRVDGLGADMVACDVVEADGGVPKLLRDLGRMQRHLERVGALPYRVGVER